MAKLLAFAAPILPGQTERWKKFGNALKNERSADFKASRNRLGVRERAFLQQTPNGDFVVVTLEGNDPAAALKNFAATDDFSRWFAEEVKAIHGIDIDVMKDAQVPELIVDSGELAPSAR